MKSKEVHAQVQLVALSQTEYLYTATQLLAIQCVPVCAGIEQYYTTWATDMHTHTNQLLLFMSH